MAGPGPGIRYLCSERESGGRHLRQVRWREIITAFKSDILSGGDLIYLMSLIGDFPFLSNTSVIRRALSRDYVDAVGAVRPQVSQPCARSSCELDSRWTYVRRPRPSDFTIDLSSRLTKSIVSLVGHSLSCCFSTYTSRIQHIDQR